MRFREEIQAVPRQIDITCCCVVAGILRDRDGRVLITERIGDHAFVGLWEFPGGKIKDGEESLSALKRELGEELGIEVLTQTLFMNLEHNYPDRLVSIDFYLINTWTNVPKGMDGQVLKWLRPDAIEEELLLPADGPVVQALRHL